MEAQKYLSVGLTHVSNWQVRKSDPDQDYHEGRMMILDRAGEHICKRCSAYLVIPQIAFWKVCPNHLGKHLHTHTPSTHIHIHEIALIKGLPRVVFDGDDGQQPILANQQNKWSPMTPHQSAGCQQAFSQPTSPASYEYKKQLKWNKVLSAYLQTKFRLQTKIIITMGYLPSVMIIDNVCVQEINTITTRKQIFAILQTYLMSGIRVLKTI